MNVLFTLVTISSHEAVFNKIRTLKMIVEIRMFVMRVMIEEIAMTKLWMVPIFLNAKTTLMLHSFMRFSGEFCITCDSELDRNCIDNVNFTMRTQCSLTVTGMGCYLFDDGGEIVKRGCVSDLIPEEVSMCRQEGQFCKTCRGNDCNNQLQFQQCLSCDSMTNDNCFDLTEPVPSTLCRNYLDTCTTHFENNRTIRGCSSQRNDLQLACASNPSLCKTCNTINCNDDVSYEAEFCVSCSSEVDPDCRNRPDLSTPKQCGAGLKINKNGCYRFDDSGITLEN